MFENNTYHSRVKDMLSTNILKVPQGIQMDVVIEKMLTENIPEVLIIESENGMEKLIGMITLSDVSKIKKLNHDLSFPVSNFMNNHVISINSDALTEDVRKIIIENKIGRLPVFENNHIIGIIRSGNIPDFFMKFISINQQYKQIFNHMHEGVTVTDSEGHILLWNKSAEKIYGIKAEELLYKKLEDFFPNALTLSVLKKRIPIENVYHSPKPNYYVIISALPIYSNDEFVGVVSTERDITDYTNLSLKLENAHSQISYLKEEVKKISTDLFSFGHIHGKNIKMEKIISLAKHVSQTDTSVLISGESGTGKEVLARSIHQNSGRQGHFVPVNCSAIPHTLFESEFFGYVGGAFTGALKKGKLGLFELANHGTLFLDEIGDLPLEVQAKLLRVLQEGKVYRVGANKPIDVDVRIISATNKNLKEMVFNRTFREDLYYRLNVVEIELPPLRERKEDIIQLFNHFLKEICTKNNILIKHVDKDVLNLLLKYNWKGNIRELKNTVEYMVVLNKNQIISKESLPQYIMENKGSSEIKNDEGKFDLEDTLKKTEIELIRKAMEKSKNNKAKAAKLLNIPRSTLYYKLNLYGLDESVE